jgi:hypothetical protein
VSGYNEDAISVLRRGKMPDAANYAFTNLNFCTDDQSTSFVLLSSRL